MAAKHSRPKHAAMATAAGGADVQIAQREVVRSRLLPLTIAELDALLDVPVLRFPQNTKKLASRLRRQDRDVDVAAYRNSRLQPVTVAENSQRDGSGGFYQAEVRRIPPMDREEEFRMARRYEFLRTRLALTDAHGAHGRGEAGGEVLGDRLVHEEAVRGRAGLAAVAQLRVDRAGDG